MTVIKDLRERVDALEERDCSCSGSAWASEVGFPLAIVAITALIYVWYVAGDQQVRTAAYQACAAAKELSPACDIVLRNK